MAETTKNKSGKYKAQSAKTVTPVTNVEPLNNSDNLLDGFTPAQLASLARVKHEVASGKYSDITPEFRKLLFVKWLLDHDRIGS
jgi:hypothetical protein